MDEFQVRQTKLLRELIRGFRANSLSLDSLIQRVEGVGESLASDAWKQAVFPIVLSMEQINAATLESGREMMVAERESISESLEELERLIDRFWQND
jgi:hypothetical protein